jgi:hypothetical protein
MPFDNTNVMRESAVRDPPVSIDPLERLGITPVPPEFVDFYKKDYRKRFMASKWPKGPGPFKWRTFDIDCRDRMGLAWHLENEPRWFTSNDDSVAPSAVVDLATRVSRAVPGARFSLDYFYTDPILHVTYDAGGQTRSACLGIWDRGEIVAIANKPVHIPERRGFFATLFGGRSFAE